MKLIRFQKDFVSPWFMKVLLNEFQIQQSLTQGHSPKKIGGSKLGLRGGPPFLLVSVEKYGMREYFSFEQEKRGMLCIQMWLCFIIPPQSFFRPW